MFNSFPFWGKKWERNNFRAMKSRLGLFSKRIRNIYNCDKTVLFSQTVAKVAKQCQGRTICHGCKKVEWHTCLAVLQRWSLKNLLPLVLRRLNKSRCFKNVKKFFAYTSTKRSFFLLSQNSLDFFYKFNLKKRKKRNSFYL